ncbi:DUF5946 family protein [Cohnella caldifontis]|uniref:DUF5946 family protein n=1 Tax=Cohnella caldifontis TaxID=3027471 RepID=UPI0023EB75D3|nr:DUF5946 family protein [Cohnella sp. YIM B05605]
MANADIAAVMKEGACVECGARTADGLACHDLFGRLLAWEQDDAELASLHYWNVACYMLQHPSNYTEEGYAMTAGIFREAYDRKWNTSEILEATRTFIADKGKFKITNPLPSGERRRLPREWSMTIEDIYRGGERNAAQNVKVWRSRVRREL